MKDPKLAGGGYEAHGSRRHRRKVHSLIDKVYHRTNLEMAWETVRANGHVIKLSSKTRQET
ncbi:hypothetical protein [Paenibacillus sp. MZ03-122A]|uniref:hypothetical protein n=1 Tax=Paenibacillus sp. MZ03-122A TaxID=2962033 RepID=UPI0020B7D38B|nr:hypothetical protein [Paenibacillus sp. MZ03-122A]MCP3778710.1 hypothetical protein [Paenibacillus sp. MZ03-122A]